jgi:hypothetical protein
MRWLIASVLWLCLAVPSGAAEAVSGRVIKVLPLFLDTQGRTSKTPSLFDRDAYQAVLRSKPEQRSGLEFAVQWKAKGPSGTLLTLRLEARGGPKGKPPTQVVLEQTEKPRGGWFGTWTSFKIGGPEYRNFGELTAWRVSLWEGARLIGEQKSFLWEGGLRLPAPSSTPAGTSDRPDPAAGGPPGAQ